MRAALLALLLALAPAGLAAGVRADFPAPCRDDARGTFEAGKLHGGLLHAPGERDPRLKVSAGRQNVTPHHGFLVAQSGPQGTAGPRPGICLAPRTARDTAGIASARAGAWSAQGFSLDPDACEPMESSTRLPGLDLGQRIGGRLAVNATALHVPRSDTAHHARDGLPTCSARSRRCWNGPPRARRSASRARGAVERGVADRPARTGGRAGPVGDGRARPPVARGFPDGRPRGLRPAGPDRARLPRSPGLSHRLAHSSGDDPATRRHERFDSLRSGGLDRWPQGIRINKPLIRPTRTSHRLRLDVGPSPRLDLALEWYLHRADEPNSLRGETRPSARSPRATRARRSSSPRARRSRAGSSPSRSAGSRCRARRSAPRPRAPTSPGGRRRRGSSGPSDPLPETRR